MLLIPFLDAADARATQRLQSPWHEPFCMGMSSILEAGPALNGPRPLPPLRSDDEQNRECWDDVGGDIGWALDQLVK